MKLLSIKEKGEETILKDGRKVYARVSLNSNPDFKWMLWLRGGALSGFNSKEEAIDRANEMKAEWNALLASLK